MIDKKRLCYILRSRYPAAFGIRKFLERKKIERLFRFNLTEQEVVACEKDATKKKDIIAPYVSKYHKYLRPCVEEMESILSNAPRYKDRADKEELKTDILFCRLAYGFLPSEYTGFDLENKTPEERKQFVSDLDTYAFGYTVNDITEMQSIWDKGDAYHRFKTYFKRDAVVVCRASDYEAYKAFVSKHPVFVLKKVFSSMGKGTELVDIREVGMSEREYFDKLVKSGKVLLEERVIQHAEMAKFNSSSVNTIRCMTFNTKHGVIVPYCFMRTGRKGSFVDNGGSGGLLIGVDTETGVLNTDAFDEYTSSYTEHPDSGVTFKGNQLPAWQDMIELCKSIAANVKDVNFLSFDMAYTDEGWVVIEVNEIGQLIGPQIVMRRGIKAEIESYLKEMKKVI